MHAHKILNIAPAQPGVQETLSRQLGISKILAQVLANRGIKTKEEAEKFLNIKLEHLLDPYSFTDMPRAVSLIQQAAKNKEKVMVFGDYDVDGITSTALLKLALARLGVEALHYLPHRVKEGYGLSQNALRFAKEKKVKLVITADCGINNHEEVSQLRRNNIDVIITDHHEPLNADLPRANSIINPKVENSAYKYRDLAGVGVAYKLAQALAKQSLFEDLDLVSLGTIADVVPLTGENRIFAKVGLKMIRESKKMGIKALIEESGIKDKEITSTFVSFILGPRLNASGRIDSAEVALNLLLSAEEKEAEALAKMVEAHNRQRQKIEGKVMEEAQVLVDREVNFKEHKIIVIAKEDWHPGVLGIVASKLADRFYRPAIVISLNYDLCKGSARSIKNFHLFQALSECSDLLEDFGGHAHAAGLVITKDSIEDFRKSMNRLAKEKLALEDLLPSLDIDMELALSDLDEKMISQLQALEPFGAGNPEPLFYSRNLKLKGQPQVLGRNTLKFWASDGQATYQAIGFGLGNFQDSLVATDSFDLVYTPRIDNWQGEGCVLLEVRDIFFK
ncbi:MAG: single-stranded-DNA-specific exonuclease RecJ [Candidatus Omnitrophica bacterium]|nr:single-stranded-DNA-specific exonuclease RecJ [Candidatus Omnitrophota bacterium]